MQHDHTEVIEQTVTDVLEQLAFVFADYAERGELPAEMESAIAVRMGIRGAATGQLTVISGPDVCLELASNLTGEAPEDINGEVATQALMELANVLCGQLLTEIAGVEPVFDLDPPESIPNMAAIWQALRDDEYAVAFLADDCPLLVRLELDMPHSKAA